MGRTADRRQFDACAASCERSAEDLSTNPTLNFRKVGFGEATFGIHTMEQGRSTGAAGGQKRSVDVQK
jgi:hypothetical protein